MGVHDRDHDFCFWPTTARTPIRSNPLPGTNAGPQIDRDGEGFRTPARVRLHGLTRRPHWGFGSKWANSWLARIAPTTFGKRPRYTLGGKAIHSEVSSSRTFSGIRAMKSKVEIVEALSAYFRTKPQKDIALKAGGVSLSTVKKWCASNSMPSGEAFINLAANDDGFFNLFISLTGRSSAPFSEKQRRDLVCLLRTILQETET